MVLQPKTKTSLLKLLESHTWANVPEVVVQTKSPTPPPTQISQPDLADKNKKWDQKVKEVVEEGKGLPPKEAEPQKGPK